VPGSNLVVEVHKVHAHFFLAEYDFKLILRSGSREIDFKEMGADTGGLSRIDVLRVDSKHYAFRDHVKTACLDVGERKFDRDCELSKPAIRIGHFDFDSSRRWRYISEID
jgi:hypothetical protein